MRKIRSRTDRESISRNKEPEEDVSGQETGKGSGQGDDKENKEVTQPWKPRS